MKSERTYQISIFAECDEEKIKRMRKELSEIIDRHLGKNGYNMEICDNSTGEYFDF